MSSNPEFINPSVLGAIYRMADKFGHEWTRHTDELSFVYDHVAASAAATASMERSREEYRKSGLSAPGGLWPDLYHTTMTGRSSWGPSSDGERLKLEVSRPGGPLGGSRPVILAEVDFSTDRPTITAKVDADATHLRHLLAFEEMESAAVAESATDREAEYVASPGDHESGRVFAAVAEGREVEGCEVEFRDRDYGRDEDAGYAAGFYARLEAAATRRAEYEAGNSARRAALAARVQAEIEEGRIRDYLAAAES